MLADVDPRWLDYRSVALTDFHRELRESLDELAREQGRDRITVSACVLNREENLRNGLDLKSWVAEELVDTLIPYTDLAELDSMGMAWEYEAAVRHFVELVEGTKCQLPLNVMPRHMSPEAFRRKAAALYARGVENLFFGIRRGQAGAPTSAPVGMRCDGWDTEERSRSGWDRGSQALRRRQFPCVVWETMT